MLKIALLFLCLGLLSLGTTGCEKKKTMAQVNAEKMKGERDNRRVLAAKYYKEIAEKYPDSPFAEKAKARLQAMGPIATPGAKTAAASPK